MRAVGAILDLHFDIRGVQNHSTINALHHCALISSCCKHHLQLVACWNGTSHCMLYHIAPSESHHRMMARSFPNNYGSRWPLRVTSTLTNWNKTNAPSAIYSLRLLIQSISPLISQPKEMRAWPSYNKPWEKQFANSWRGENLPLGLGDWFGLFNFTLVQKWSKQAW